MTSQQEAALARVVAFLRREHANERGAALAYRGHWRSVRDPAERAHIAQIEAEEWHHREAIEGLLSALDAAPNRWVEAPLAAAGATLGLLCFVTGWLAPMIGAGWIERINALGYLQAAQDAETAGRPDLARALTALGAVEIDHHAWFHARVSTHWLGRRLWLRAPLPRPALAGPGTG